MAWFAAFDRRLMELGYIEGKNLVTEFQNAEGKPERLFEIAAEMVRHNVDLLLAGGPEAPARASRQATSTIPIVIVAVDYDPVATGYAASLARPGGNVTGVFLQPTGARGQASRAAQTGAAENQPRRGAVDHQRYAVESDGSGRKGSGPANPGAGDAQPSLRLRERFRRGNPRTRASDPALYDGWDDRWKANRTQREAVLKQVAVV